MTCVGASYRKGHDIPTNYAWEMMMRSIPNDLQANQTNKATISTNSLKWLIEYPMETSQWMPQLNVYLNNNRSIKPNRNAPTSHSQQKQA